MDYYYDRRCASRGGACDSSQMSSVLCHEFVREVQEEAFVKEEVDSSQAVPFDSEKVRVIAIIKGKVVNADEVADCDLLIEDGKITQVGPDLEIPDDAQIIDASDKYVLPGAVDYDRRLTDETGLDLERISELTRAQVLGGITSVFTLVHNSDYQKSKEFVENMKNSENPLFCNLAIKLGTQDVGETPLGDGELGVTTLHLPAEQAFMLEDEDLLNLMKRLKVEGGVLNVDVKQGVLDDDILEGKSTMTPLEDLEESVVRKICTFALQVDLTVCFLNLGHPGLVDVVSDYRLKGLSVYCDVLTQRMLASSVPWTHQNILLSSQQSGIHTDKMVDEEEAEDWISSAYHKLVTTDGVEITKFAEVTSTNPARLMNVYPRKGCLRENCDADLYILDPMKGQQVSRKSRTLFNLEKDSDVFGIVEHVLVAGKLVVSDSQLRPMAKWGNFLSCQPFPTAAKESPCQMLRKPLERLDCPRNQAESPKEGRKAWDKRKCASQGEIFSKELGIYQRPLSAHGVRNQQDSTFTVKTFF